MMCCTHTVSCGKKRSNWSHKAQVNAQLKDLSELMMTASYLSRNGMKTIHDFASLLTEATQVLNDEKAKGKQKKSVSGILTPSWTL